MKLTFHYLRVLTPRLREAIPHCRVTGFVASNVTNFGASKCDIIGESDFYSLVVCTSTPDPYVGNWSPPLGAPPEPEK